ncbi:MAG: hypothetical protein IT431_09490 [Phycisphaerales bacterium]|nr:hypothetical protein [Phycisphaerales bacterium]
MHPLARVVPALLAALLLLVAPARAQDGQALPGAESLFEKHVEAIGGRAALDKHRDRILHGIYTIIQSGETQVLTIYTQAPNRMRAELDAPALGTTTRATDGTQVWGTNNTGSPFHLTGRDRDELVDSAGFLGEADYKNAYTSITTVGTVNIDGRPAWRVDFTTKSGLQGSVYFDVETGRVSARQLLPADPKANHTLIVVGDYKEFDGVQLPTRQRQLVGEKLQPVVEIEYRWVEVNTGKMPEFAAPENTATLQDTPG